MLPTFQEAHRTVQTFRTQFIVTKGSQELADEYVGFLRDIQLAHVSKEDRHKLFPMRALELLQPI